MMDNDKKILNKLKRNRYGFLTIGQKYRGPEEACIMPDKVKYMSELMENLSNSGDFNDVLSSVYDSLSLYMPCVYMGVALKDDKSKTIRVSYGAAARKYRNLHKSMLACKAAPPYFCLPSFNASYDNSGSDCIIGDGEERLINDFPAYVEGKSMGEYSRILINEGIHSLTVFPLKSNSRVLGTIFFCSDKRNAYNEEHMDFLRMLVNCMALGIEKFILLDDMIVSSVMALAELAEQRDPETGEHLRRMSLYSRKIAELLSLNDKYKDTIDANYIESIEKFSQLHDIGKIGIRDDILLKQGRLTPEEFAVMKTHTIYGAWVLKNVDENIRKYGRSIFAEGIDIAEGHHEKWDGTGYPYGKRGDDIPLSARIVAAADVFDALTNKRPYKSAFSFEKSCKIIIEGSGKQFDPDIADLFVKYNEEIRALFENLSKTKAFSVI